MARIEHAARRIMRIRFIAALATLPLAACAGGDEGPTPYDDEHGPSEDIINDNAPPNDSLPDEGKADEILPAKFEVGFQSPVKSQGSRGVCSIFSSTAQVENLYIKAGMPIAEADFSEQYLQWATKNLSRAFRNTAGSSSEVNARTVVQFGTVKEAIWPYETVQWNASNDPECDGDENLPTKCYTNGEPPAAASQARKYKLPSSRWINNNSIKSYIFNHGVGLNVGMTFFYQSWNHRKSVLPISNDLWRTGVVTYPNAKDKEESLKSRAGHAIHIVGWDDNFEVCERDGEGKEIPLPNGECRKEKGFYIFKNSWGTAGFGIDHPTGAGYGYLSYRYVREYGSAVVAEMPTLEAPREICDDAGEVDEDGDGQANCLDADCMMHPACAGGGGTHTFTATPAEAIPDQGELLSSVEATQNGKVAGVKVTVDITHTWRGDLRITLIKGNKSVVLIDRQGGSADDIKQTFDVTGFEDLDLRGTWTLKVEDTARLDTGTLNSWSLEVATN
jgi:hypothetical protein